MKKLILALSLTLCTLFSSTIFAQDNTVYKIEKGQVAQTSGYILTPLKMADVIAKLKTSEQFSSENLQLELHRQKEIDIAQCDKKVNDLLIVNDASKKIRDVELVESNKRVNILTQHISQLEKKSSPNVTLYVTSGFVGGIVATIGGIILYNKVK